MTGSNRVQESQKICLSVLDDVFYNDRQPVPQSSDIGVVRALYPFKDAYNQVCPPILGPGMCGCWVLLTFNLKIVGSIQQRF
jgi:hypothetical protein